MNLKSLGLAAILGLGMFGAGCTKQACTKQGCTKQIYCVPTIKTTEIDSTETTTRYFYRIPKKQDTEKPGTNY